MSPKDLVLVLDRSGSMSGAKIEQAKAALTYVFEDLNAGDRFNVIVYSDSVGPISTPRIERSRRNRKSSGMIDRINAWGGTISMTRLPRQSRRSRHTVAESDPSIFCF